MFSCTKCNEPLYIRSADIKDKILTMEVQCLRGHRSVRRMAEHQVNELAKDIFDRVFVCIDCGSHMSLLRSDASGSRTDIIMLCPLHGPQKREVPGAYQATIDLLAAETSDASKSIVESFACPHCRQTFAISEMDARGDILQLIVRCSNGHRETRYIPSNVESNLLKKVLQRLVHCDRCLLPGTIVSTESRGRVTRIHTSCPVHGIVKRDVPTDIVGQLQAAVSEIPKDAVVRATLVSRDCRRPLAVTRIEEEHSGYRLRCVCPGTGQQVSRSLPLEWDDIVKTRIAAAVLSCEYCGLLTQIVHRRKKRAATEFDLICPVHGMLTRETPSDVYDYVFEKSGVIDRVPSMVRSLSCDRCNMPLSARDVEQRGGLVEFDMYCRNGHKTKRFFIAGLDKEVLIGLYKNMYQCPECYGPLDLVYAKQEGRESKVVLLCPIDGKFVLNIPPDHAEAMQLAYKEMQEDRVKPPEEAVETAKSVDLEAVRVKPDDSEGGVGVFRGCDIVGGKFDYKVKVTNESGYVITNVTVSIVAFPQDCMELGGETIRTLSRIEVGGFRSPQFTLYPTKDCVQGKIVATVSYIDFRDHLHTIQVEPYLIRSVCDMLKPSEKSSKEFDLILAGLSKTNQEQTLDWNSRVLFTKAEMILPSKNFHIVDSGEKIVAGEFIGSIRGFAEGKYTGKKVAVVFTIVGPEEGRHSLVKVEALGEDVAMLPTTVDELAETMDSWICLRCGAPLEPEQVEELGKRNPIRCKYCAHTLTMALYMQ